MRNQKQGPIVLKNHIENNSCKAACSAECSNCKRDDVKNFQEV